LGEGEGGSEVLETVSVEMGSVFGLICE